jgi:hypothetical protein
MRDDGDQLNNELPILNSVFDGHSEYSVKYNNRFIKFYLKHPAGKDSGSLYNEYEKARKKYIKEGLMSKDEQLEFILNNGWWSKEKENEIKYLEDSIKRFEQTRKKLLYQSDKRRINEQLADLTKKLAILRKEKSEFLSSTADDLASYDAANFFIENFVFFDKDFKKPFIIDDNDDDYYSSLINLYYRYSDEFSIDKIKKAALSMEFQNMLYISDGSCTDIFGMPVVRLTKNQADLLMWGGYYQKLIKSSQKEIPIEMYNDPEKFIEWYESVNKIEISEKNKNKKAKKKSKYGSDSKYLFGERDEIKEIGGQISGDKVLKDAEKSGGLGIYDLMEK